MFGLKDEHIELLLTCFRKYSEIQKVILYGSRAKGTFKNGSDIDLSIVDDGNFNQILQLENELDDLMLPHKTDLSLKRQISNPELLNHIERVGIVFYSQEGKNK